MAGGDRLELVDPPSASLGTLLEGQRAEGVQAVRLDPEIRVGQAAAELGGVD